MPLNIDIQQVLLHMLNFAVLFGAMYFLLYKPVKKFMDDRNDHYDELEEKADSALKEAERIKGEYEEKMSQSDSEAAKKKAEILGQANAEADKIRSNAQNEASEIISKARSNAAKEKDAIIRSANDDINRLAVEAAEKLVFADSSDAYDNFIDITGEDAGGENE